MTDLRMWTEKVSRTNKGMTPGWWALRVTTQSLKKVQTNRSMEHDPLAEPGLCLQAVISLFEEAHKLLLLDSSIGIALEHEKRRRHQFTWHVNTCHPLCACAQYGTPSSQELSYLQNRREWTSDSDHHCQHNHQAHEQCGHKPCQESNSQKACLLVQLLSHMSWSAMGVAHFDAENMAFCRLWFLFEGIEEFACCKIDTKSCDRDGFVSQRINLGKSPWTMTCESGDEQNL